MIKNMDFNAQEGKIVFEGVKQKVSNSGEWSINCLIYVQKHGFYGVKRKNSVLARGV